MAEPKKKVAKPFVCHKVRRATKEEKKQAKQRAHAMNRIACGKLERGDTRKLRRHLERTLNAPQATV